MNQNTKEGLSLSELRSMGYDDLQKLSEEGLINRGTLGHEEIVFAIGEGIINKFSYDTHKLISSDD